MIYRESFEHMIAFEWIVKAQQSVNEISAMVDSQFQSKQDMFLALPTLETNSLLPPSNQKVKDRRLAHHGAENGRTTDEGKENTSESDQ